MILTIKQLKQGETIIAPQTVAEAVLVKQGSTIITLDKVINKKIDNVTSTEELTVTRKGNDIDITHTNQIQSTDTPRPLQVQYDSSGHIINSASLGKLTILANGQTIIESDGSDDQQLRFDDNFEKDDNNNITIRWNNL